MKQICVLLFYIAVYSPEDKVYICFSKGASRYHYKEHCRGLSACGHLIKKVTLEDARELGFTLCRWGD